MGSLNIPNNPFLLLPDRPGSATEELPCPRRSHSSRPSPAWRRSIAAPSSASSGTRSSCIATPTTTAPSPAPSKPTSSSSPSTRSTSMSASSSRPTPRPSSSTTPSPRSSTARSRSCAAGSSVLLVNYSVEMTMDTISLFHQLGLNHLEFVPCYPGVANVPRLEVAVTPGERKHVPSFVKRVVDIGDRVMDARTIIDIAAGLGLERLLKEERFVEYFKSIRKSPDSLTSLFDRHQHPGEPALQPAGRAGRRHRHHREHRPRLRRQPQGPRGAGHGGRLRRRPGRGPDPGHPLPQGAGSLRGGGLHPGQDPFPEHLREGGAGGGRRQDPGRPGHRQHLRGEGEEPAAAALPAAREGTSQPLHLRRHPDPERRLPGDQGPGPQEGQVRCLGADHRRDGHRQGALRPRHPSRLPAEGLAVRHHQLRRPAREPPGERAVRLRGRRLHRRPARVASRGSSSWPTRAPSSWTRSAR